MKRSALSVLLAISLIACAAKAPVAHLSYLGIKAVGFNYHLKFSSDVPILELFSKNKHQRIVFAELVCSLDADNNFEIGHRMRFFAQGGIEFIEKASIAGRTSYIFDSDISFREAPRNELGSDQTLSKEELNQLLNGKISIPCKVRMTVNFSNPYYSETFFVPAKDVLTLEIGGKV